ncbi:MAG: ABC transporter permease subunit, partial [Pseudomonadota bacterium]
TLGRILQNADVGRASIRNSGRLRAREGNCADCAPCASKWKILLLIKIPAAMPNLASGLRVAIVYAPMGAIIGEWVGSSRGLGYLMQMANTRMDIALMFAVLLLIIALTLLFYFTIDFLLKKFIWWQ